MLASTSLRCVAVASVPTSTRLMPVHGHGVAFSSESASSRWQAAPSASEAAQNAAETLEQADAPASASQPVTNFPLEKSLISQLQRSGFTTLFPVQASTLHHILDGKDVVVRARTGSGKTLGFAVPLAQRLLTSAPAEDSFGRRLPRAIVLAPTRELARQVGEEFGRVLPRGLKAAIVYGGSPFPAQESTLRKGVDVVVGTPGRVLDHLQRRTLDLSACDFVVLDEADEMLNMGFKEDVEKVFNATPEGRSCMLWSATVPSWVHRLSSKYCADPVLVDLVGDEASKIPATVDHRAVVIQDAPLPSGAHGAETLREHIIARALERLAPQGPVLVFTQTKRETRELVGRLRVPGVQLVALEGDMSQGAREAALRQFKSGRAQVLVATDVAARGLDIDSVRAVVHASLPHNEEPFVHRTGRTGRAGKSGSNVIICDAEDRGTLGRYASNLSISVDFVTPAALPTTLGGAGSEEGRLPRQQTLQLLRQAARAARSSGVQVAPIRGKDLPDELSVEAVYSTLLQAVGGDGTVAGTALAATALGVGAAEDVTASLLTGNGRQVTLAWVPPAPMHRLRPEFLQDLQQACDAAGVAGSGEWDPLRIAAKYMSLGGDSAQAEEGAEEDPLERRGTTVFDVPAHLAGAIVAADTSGTLRVAPRLPSSVATTLQSARAMGARPRGGGSGRGGHRQGWGNGGGSGRHGQQRARGGYTGGQRSHSRQGGRDGQRRGGDDFWSGFRGSGQRGGGSRRAGGRAEGSAAWDAGAQHRRNGGKFVW